MLGGLRASRDNASRLMCFPKEIDDCPLLQIEKLKYAEAKRRAQGHSVSSLAEAGIDTRLSGHVGRSLAAVPFLHEVH